MGKIQQLAKLPKGVNSHNYTSIHTTHHISSGGRFRSEKAI